jgi:hypothetical protein
MFNNLAIDIIFSCAVNVVASGAYLKNIWNGSSEQRGR